MNEFEKHLKKLYENKKKFYPIKYPWDDENAENYAIYCAREIMEIVDKMYQEFPKLEAGTFSKLPDGTINDFWAKEVLEWVVEWLKK